MQAQPRPQPAAPVQPQATVANTQVKKPIIKKPKANVFGFVKKGRFWFAAALAILLAVIGYLGYQYYAAGNNSAVKGAQTDTKDMTTEDLVKEIRTMILLPDEAPQVATINNIDVLKGKDFFKDAQNGDDVLIFKKAERGLIYRRSTHMIIAYEKVQFSGSLPQ